MQHTHDIPVLGYGLGLRSAHLAHIFTHKPKLDWFEIISENHMFDEGRAKQNLARIRADYPVAMHGVSLSIGTVDPLNSEYLRALKKLIGWLEPSLVTDHLCWTGVAHKNTHDLLPVPYTEEALAHIVQRIGQVQDYLGRRIFLENPSTYLEFQSSAMPEAEFIARMVKESGCGLLLDVNNVYVNCFNHRLDVKRYLDALPLDQVGQIHLSGHSNHGTHIIDTHDDHVVEEVWAIYRYVIAKAGMKNTMVEWDAKIPPFEVLLAELEKARKAGSDALPPLAGDHAIAISNEAAALGDEQQRLQAAILAGGDDAPKRWIRDKPGFAPEAQLAVYGNAYRVRLCENVAENFPVLREYFGDENMDGLIRDYVEATPSVFADAARYPEGFPAFVFAQTRDVFAHELAALEQALAMLHAMPQSEALTPQHLAGIDADALMAMQLKTRAASVLLPSRTNANDYFAAVMLDEEPPVPQAIDGGMACYLHEGDVWRLPLEAGEHRLLALIRDGVPVGEALEQSGADEAQVSAWFARWMQHGVLAA